MDPQSSLEFDQFTPEELASSSSSFYTADSGDSPISNAANLPSDLGSFKWGGMLANFSIKSLFLKPQMVTQDTIVDLSDQPQSFNSENALQTKHVDDYHVLFAKYALLHQEFVEFKNSKCECSMRNLASTEARLPLENKAEARETSSLEFGLGLVDVESNSVEHESESHIVDRTHDGWNKQIHMPRPMQQNQQAPMDFIERFTDFDTAMALYSSNEHGQTIISTVGTSYTDTVEMNAEMEYQEENGEFDTISDELGENLEGGSDYTQASNTIHTMYTIDSSIPVIKSPNESRHENNGEKDQEQRQTNGDELDVQVCYASKEYENESLNEDDSSGAEVDEDGSCEDEERNSYGTDTDGNDGLLEHNDHEIDVVELTQDFHDEDYSINGDDGIEGLAEKPADLADSDIENSDLLETMDREHVDLHCDDDFNGENWVNDIADDAGHAPNYQGEGIDQPDLVEDQVNHLYLDLKEIAGVNIDSANREECGSGDEGNVDEAEQELSDTDGAEIECNELVNTYYIESGLVQDFDDSVENIDDENYVVNAVDDEGAYSSDHRLDEFDKLKDGKLYDDSVLSDTQISEEDEDEQDDLLQESNDEDYDVNIDSSDDGNSYNEDCGIDIIALEHLSSQFVDPLLVSESGTRTGTRSITSENLEFTASSEHMNIFTDVLLAHDQEDVFQCDQDDDLAVSAILALEDQNPNDVISYSEAEMQSALDSIIDLRTQLETVCNQSQLDRESFNNQILILNTENKSLNTFVTRANNSLSLVKAINISLDSKLTKETQQNSTLTAENTDLQLEVVRVTQVLDKSRLDAQLKSDGDNIEIETCKLEIDALSADISRMTVEQRVVGCTLSSCENEEHSDCQQIEDGEMIRMATKCVSQIATYQSDISKSSNSLKQETQKLCASQTTVSELQCELAQSESRTAALEKNNSRLSSDLKSAQSNLEETKSNLRTLQSECKTHVKTANVSTLKIQKLDSQLASLLADIDVQKAKIDGRDSEAVAFKAQIKMLQGEESAAKKEVERNHAEIAKLNGDANYATQNLNFAVGFFNTTVSALEATISNLETTSQSTQLQLANSTAKISQLQVENIRLTSTISRASDLICSLTLLCQTTCRKLGDFNGVVPDITIPYPRLQVWESYADHIYTLLHTNQERFDMLSGKLEAVIEESQSKQVASRLLLEDVSKQGKDGLEMQRQEYEWRISSVSRRVAELDGYIAHLEKELLISRTVEDANQDDEEDNGFWKRVVGKMQSAVSATPFK